MQGEIKSNLLVTEEQDNYMKSYNKMKYRNCTKLGISLLCFHLICLLWSRDSWACTSLLIRVSMYELTVDRIYLRSRSVLNLFWNELDQKDAFTKAFRDEW